MQLDETHRKIVDVGVGLFHREGSDAEGARQKKRALADKVAPVLRSIADNPKAYFILSELMHALELPSEALRNLYLSGADVQQAATAETGRRLLAAPAAMPMTCSPACWAAARRTAHRPDRRRMPREWIRMNTGSPILRSSCG